MRAHGLVGFVGNVGCRDQRHGLGPFERRSLAIAEERRFAPRIQAVQALLRLAFGSRILGMHVQTVSAAVDLRGAHHQQMQQLAVQAAGVDGALHREQWLHELHIPGDIDSGFHVCSPFVSVVFTDKTKRHPNL